MLSKLKISILAACLLFAIGLQSCKPDDPDEDEDCVDGGLVGTTCPDPTPYNYTRPSGLPQVDLPVDNPLTEEGVALGRLLFYDPILSLDSTQSCGSCHKQENAFADPRRFSVGITGAVGDRNSMALFNMLWHREGLFWDGRAKTLKDQVTQPVTNPIEMAHVVFCDALESLRKSSFYRGKFCEAFGTDEINQIRYEHALEQFILTLISVESKTDRIDRSEPGYSYSFDELMGRGLFNQEPPEGGDCFHCHGGGTFGTHQYSNNGLDTAFSDLGRFDVTKQEYDKGKFKIPTLRNIEFTAPYMHDGRFNTLEEVMDFYTNGVHGNSPNLDPLMKKRQTDFKLDLTKQQQLQLIAYLKTLSDTAFIKNPAHSNPFK